MDDDEVALKAKLDQTEDIEERRELRKQIREIRNRKFEEELKKISGGEKTTSTLTTDISSRKTTRVPTTNEDECEDPYGLSEYTTESALQDLLNGTPFTETDKRRKIRARMREVRNAEFDKTISATTTTTTTRSTTRVKEPSAEPIQKPSAVREPSPEPVREPSPEPVREPSPEPVREPSPEPVREPSPEPVREPSPEPVREPSPEPEREASPERYGDEREQSPEMREVESESASEGESPYDDEYSDEEIDLVDDGSDFTERLKTREDAHAVLSLERPLNQGGEQVDFRDLLKRKSEAPILNLERKPVETEQIDFRVALERKVEMPVKKEEPSSGEQVDFRNALKKKIEKPVFDKTPAPAAQVDFRAHLSRNVRTITMEDKDLPAEQKDFRVVLGKAPPSPKTGRRHKGIHSQESVDRCDSPDPVEHTKMEALRERTPSPDVENERAESPADIAISDSPHTSPPTKKGAKKALPPPPVKKKVAIPKPKEKEELSVSAQSSVDTQSFEQEISSSSVDPSEPEEISNEEATKREENNQESDDEVDGIARNKQVARAERTRRRQEAKEAAVEKTKEEEVVEANITKPCDKKNVEDKTSKDNKVEDKSTAEKSPRRRSKRGDEINSETRPETRPERNNRRMRRLQALENETEKKVDITPKKKEENKENKEVKTINNAEAKISDAEDHAVNGTTAEVEDVNIIETPSKDSEETKTETEVTVTPTMNGDIIQNENDGEDTKETRKSKKSKEEEKVEVSSDLLAEINKPKEEPPKKSIESQLKKNTPSSTTPLTGRAAERERERLKREEERDQKAAARAKEREEAARKRKEQKDAFDKKMAEQRRLRDLKQRNIGTNSSARASRNAFKEKLESNSPRSASPSAAPAFQVNTNLTKLLGWARKRTKGYEGVNVENFSDSWSDGLAFAALIHSFCPDLIPIDELSKETKRRNFEVAFSVAKDEGVMDLLDVEDMVSMNSPDPKSVMTYVHSVYQTFQPAT